MLRPFLFDIVSSFVMKNRERWKRIQKSIGIPEKNVDGIPGPQTLAHLESKLGIGAVGTKDPPTRDRVVDERSFKNIATLEPLVQPLFREILHIGNQVAMQQGCTYVMISGNRTWKEQDKLYAKGRTAPGNIVTNARGGFSNHNYAIAGDYGVFRSGKYLDSTDPAEAIAIHKLVAAQVLTKFGTEIEWGGNWKSFKDYPHFQYNNGLTMTQMRKRVIAGKAIV